MELERFSTEISTELVEVSNIQDGVSSGFEWGLHDKDRAWI